MTSGVLGLPPEVVREIAWVLLQFVWQALALAALMELILRNCGDASARHNRALCILILILAAPVAPFMGIHYNFGFLPTFTSTDSATSVGVARVLSNFMFSSWVGWIVVAWFAGISAFILRAIGGWFVANELRNWNISVVPEALLVRCEAMQQRLGLRRKLHFLQSDKITAPVLVGWLRPTVLVPTSAISRLPVQQLEALIVHELAHVRRSDAIINLMLVVAETMFFFHPAIWWVTRRIRTERELCCDDIAVSICADAAEYADALLSLHLLKPSRTFALASNGGTLMRRISRVVGKPEETKKSSLAAILGVVILCVVAAAVSAQTFPMFSIRIIDDTASLNTGVVPPGDDLVRTSEPGKGMPPAFLLRRQGAIQGNVVSEAHVTNGPDGKPLVQFRLTPAARDEFASLSRRNIGHRAAIVVNNTVVASPVIKEPMLSGQGQISGNYTEIEARALASVMTTGAR